MKLFSLRKIKQHLEITISVILISISLFYVFGAQKFRNNLKQVHPEAFSEGEIVTVSAAIDGDEVKIMKADGSHTVVRIVGIQSDTVQSRWGGQCFDFIKNHFVGKQAKLFFDSHEKRTDSKKRLLAYLHIQDDGDFIKDIGLELVKSGMAAVYSRYDFNRMHAYNQAERIAEEQKSGFWGDENAVRRVRAFKKRWQQLRAVANEKQPS